MTSHNNEKDGAVNFNNVQQDTFYENLFGINSTVSAPPEATFSAQGQDSEKNSTSISTSFHVQHCAQCINVRQCQRGAQTSSSCPIVLCRLGCQLSFHACKAAEHEDLLCPRATVPCINAQHGCPLEMERRWTGVHLQKCPANVVVCTVEWNRKPIAPWQSEHFEKWGANEKDLEISATRRDEHTVKEYYKRLPQSLRSLLRTNDKKQAIMPLGVAGTRIPKSILAQAAVEKFALGKAQQALTEATHCSSASTSKSNSSEDSPEESDGDDSSLISFSEPSYGIRRSPSAGLQQSVCSQLTAPASALPASSAAQAPRSIAKRKSRVRLSPTVDVVVKDACKYMNLFTFMCAHEFRRDEYAAHFRNMHTEILTQLNGWLWARCPMALQGCDYSVERMFPAGEGENSVGAGKYEIIRNEALDSFCVRQTSSSGNDGDTENAANKTEKIKDGDGESANVPLSICELPVEVLVHLTEYLDPLSLNALTMTNKLFLSVCQLIVEERGIVVPDWEKSNGNGNVEGAEIEDENEKDKSPRRPSWKIVDRRWMFSTHFTPIRCWRFLEPGAMSNHMATCPVLAAQRHRPSAPFCYPITKDNL